MAVGTNNDNEALKLLTKMTQRFTLQIKNEKFIFTTTATLHHCLFVSAWMPRRLCL